MNDSAPIVHRALARERDKLHPGTILSFTTLAHPHARYGAGARAIGLIELEGGRRVLGPLLGEAFSIGQHVRPRLRLSHVSAEGLRIYEAAYEVFPGIAPSPYAFPGYIIALTGPSGVGKSTISRMLVDASGKYAARVPILTTRSPKQGDDGEYVHTSPEEFERLSRSGVIVASTRIPSSGEERQYGYRSSDIEAIWRVGKVPVVITEMHLLEGLARHFGRRSVLSFGLLPPGRSKRAKLSQLLYRLRGRGRESEEYIRDRIKNAERDLAFFTERKDLFDHIVVNDDLAAIIASLRERAPGLLGT